MNLQSHRIAKYRKNKDHNDSPTGDGRAGRGLSHDNPIEIDLVSDGGPSRRGGDVSERQGSATFAGFTAHRAAAHHGEPQFATNDMGDG
ncbi:hypothetical protein C8034_v003038 [Colletotrichum sidae]|uniref:Uncharacterized protein n=1 Tax=Colletotrichum sidae TaxID=1347389 RepID=A0A4R8TAX0_9PEZI|nr:hypothetical protein C8034_v003038 [Colletotrichum sidae]